MKWPDESLERTMLADANECLEQYSRGPLSSAVARSAKSVRDLLRRVRELENREAIAIPALQRIVGTGTAAITGDWHTEVARRALEKLADIGPLPDYPA